MKFLLFITSAFLLTCTSPRQGGEAPVALKPTTSGDDTISIFYNNDNIGYLEPCGCRVTPIGGMHRRWNAMGKIPAEKRIFVDAGNMLFKSKAAPDYLATQWAAQAEGVIEAYNMLKADAATPGENDFALGVVKFLEIAKTAKFPFISSNLIYKKTKNPLLKDHVIIEKQGSKIGIFAIFNPLLSLPEELEATDPINAAETQIENLKKEGADFIIALSHQGYDADLKLLDLVNGIDLLVGANSQSLLQRPEKRNHTQVVQLSNQGQMLGVLEYEIKGSQHRLINSEVRELNSDFDSAADRDAPNPMKALIEVTNIKIAEANRKLDEKLWNSHQSADQAQYQTFLNCRLCHSKQAEFQDGHLHASSMLTLIKKKKERNMDCVKCHSVGLGSKGGFTGLNNALLTKNEGPVELDKVIKGSGLETSMANEKSYRSDPTQIRPDVAKWIAALKKHKVDRAFLGVQCENCHGARPDHPFAPDKNTKVDPNRCLGCHTKEQMPDWYDQKGILQKPKLKAAVKTITCPR